MKRLLNIYHSEVTKIALVIFVGGLGLVVLLTLLALNFLSASVQVTSENSTTLESIIKLSSENKPSPTSSPAPLPNTYVIPQQLHAFQTFNNCGPASLSMLLSYHGTNITQKELGEILRPRQHPQGIEDDKSVTIPELASEAERRGFSAYHRPGGSIPLIKTLIAHDFPVLVRTWLNASDDIGHYRIIRGYDDVTQELIQDDSLQGKGSRYDYSDFENLWLPFQSEFLVIAPLEKAEELENMLGDLASASKAWELFYEQTARELELDPNKSVHVFNQSIAAFHLGKYQQAVQLYEQVAPALSQRMLWYQIQPIEAYLRVGEYDKVFALTSEILNGPNKAFSELYIFRGQAHEYLGNRDAARQEYEIAVLYNENLLSAQTLLRELMQEN